MKFRKESEDELVSLLGHGVEVNGEISFSHGLRVDGIIKGTVRSEASLVIGPQGRLEAEVFIRKVIVGGEFHGIIHASDRVEIHKDGKVYGDIYTPCLIIDAGAVFEGKCNMSDRQDAKSGEAPVLKAVETVSEAEKLTHSGAGR